MPRRPLDLLHVVVLLALIGCTLTLTAAGRLADPWPLLALYLPLAAGVLGIAWLARKPVRRPAWFFYLVTDFYPVAVVPLIFNSLQPLITGVGVPNQDESLIAIDRALLGGHDATVWMQRWVTPWLSDLMHISYCTYFVLCLVVGVAMWLKSHETARRFIFTAALAFYASYAGYFVVPARGPRFAQAHLYTVDTRTSPISHAIYYGLDGAEKTKDNAFPSGHVTISVVCLMAAWRFNCRLFAWLLPVGVALCLSTIYCRQHYVIDVLGGLILAAIVMPVGYALYNGWRRTPARIDTEPVLTAGTPAPASARG